MSSAYTLASDVAVLAGAALLTAATLTKAELYATSLGDERTDDTLCTSTPNTTSKKPQSIRIDSGEKIARVTVEERHKLKVGAAPHAVSSKPRRVMSEKQTARLNCKIQALRRHTKSDTAFIGHCNAESIVWQEHPSQLRVWCRQPRWNSTRSGIYIPSVLLLCLTPHCAN
ncbi:MAG: hypothetical protein Q9217_000223 [Psora testacea]